MKNRKDIRGKICKYSHILTKKYKISKNQLSQNTTVPLIKQKYLQDNNDIQNRQAVKCNKTVM